MQKFTVVKYDGRGELKLHYSGELLERNQTRLLIKAHFTKPDGVFSGIHFKKGDEFYEAYFRDRWYNIDEIYDRDDCHLKGWYCNIALPPKISRWKVVYTDLALDLLVYPDGRQLVLDEDELEDLHLPADTHRSVWDGMRELQSIFSSTPNFRLKPVSS